MHVTEDEKRLILKFKNSVEALTGISKSSLLYLLPVLDFVAFDVFHPFILIQLVGIQKSIFDDAGVGRQDRVPLKNIICRRNPLRSCIL